MNEQPKVSAEMMLQFVAGELSLRARVAYTALLLIALMMTIVVGSLWLTEPALPLRTQIAFAVLTPIGLAWTAYAVWVLTRRRVLFAGHRILAGRMAVTFSTVFVAGALVLAVFGDQGRAAWSAAACGVVMVAIAGSMLHQAHKRFAALLQRRDELTRQLSAAQ
jgi:hypothetical protein